MTRLPFHLRGTPVATVLNSHGGGGMDMGSDGGPWWDRANEEDIEGRLRGIILQTDVTGRAGVWLPFPLGPGK